MLTRRHLRIRVLQALYSYYQSSTKDLMRTEQEVYKGIDKTYDLFLHLLLFFPELAEQERVYRADLPKKHIPSKTEKPVVHSLADNKCIVMIAESQVFKKSCTSRSISWQIDTELVKQVFYQVRLAEEYKKYVVTTEHTLEQDIEFCLWLFKKYVSGSDVLAHALEEKNIYWADGFEFACSFVTRTIKLMKPEKGGQFELPYIYKDEEDDRQFVKTLLQNTVTNDAHFTELIDAKTKNWDVDRIAVIDVILLKMALSEVLHLTSVPIKVSINEYLEISKDFSTPKSNLFINGVIDKLVVDLKKENRIVKTGRGLVE